jgi:hypothetical protein
MAAGVERWVKRAAVEADRVSTVYDGERGGSSRLSLYSETVSETF